MKLGLIGRAEDRGLGVLSQAFFRHMHPERTLVIAPTPNIAKGFVQHTDRFRGDGETFWLSWDGGALDESLVRRFLRGLDVVYSAETFYDPRLPDWAREEGCASVLHVMPEFFNPDLPQATETWLPTTWRADVTPHARIVPVPVEHAEAQFPLNGPLRILHVAGHRAMADRNGTLTFLQALRLVRNVVVVTIVCQDARLPSSRVAPSVALRRVLRHSAPLDDLYRTHDLMVLPRRYGGLCLPVQEALSFGLAVAMPAVPPNTDWPIEPIPARLGDDSIKTVAGEIPLAAVSPVDVARTIDALASTPDGASPLLLAAQERACEWSRSHTWRALKPIYDAAIYDAVVRHQLAARR